MGETRQSADVIVETVNRPRPGETRDCLDPWYQPFIRTNGEIWPCCWFGESLGNVNDTPFDQLLNGIRFKELRRELLTGQLRKVCVDCPTRGVTTLEKLLMRLRSTARRPRPCVGLSQGQKNAPAGDAIKVDGLFVREVSAQHMVFPLFTSIPPRLSGEALAEQREVIASWRAAGFEPISVNGPSEISLLKVLGLDVEVEPAREDGKPLVADIVAAIKRRGCERAGIVNADCKVIHYPDLALKIAAALDNGVLYAERVDVGEGCLPTVGECSGFDAFFFDVGVLGAINDEHFRLGETWWDYWFPLQLATNGAMLGNISVPLILHRRHPARWDEEQWVRHARHMSAALKEWSAQNTLRPFYSSLDFVPHSETSDVHQLLAIGTACFQWLRSRRLPHDISFLPDDMGTIEALLQNAYYSFSNSVTLAGKLATETAKLTAAITEVAAAQLEATAAQGELTAVRRKLATETAALTAAMTEVAAVQLKATAAQTELTAIRASTSWRLTGPLRQLIQRCRGADHSGALFLLASRARDKIIASFLGST